jgi:hypothetical protein
VGKRVGCSNASEPLPYIMRVGRGNAIVADFMPVLWAQWQGADESARAERTMAAFTVFSKLAPVRNVDGPNLALVANDDFDLAIHLVKGTASASVVWSAWAMAIADARLATGATDQGDRLFVRQVPGAHPALGAWLLGVPRAARDRELAHRFVHFATAKDQIRTAAGFGNPPPRTSILQEMVETYPWFTCQLESLTKARSRPRHADWRKVEGELGTILSDVYGARLTPAAAYKAGEDRLLGIGSGTGKRPTRHRSVSKN